MEVSQPEKTKPPVVDNHLGQDLRGQQFSVRTPQIYCCNCGTRKGLRPIETAFLEPYKLSNYFRKRRRLFLSLPYCAPCSVSAGKYPRFANVMPVFWFVLWLFSFSLLGSALGAAQAPAWVIVVALLMLTFGIFGLAWFVKQPRAPMTAKYQPVKIMEYNGHPGEFRADDMMIVPAISAVAVVASKVWHSAKGTNADGIDQLTFEFTNRTYGKAFGVVNAEGFERGTLKYSKRSRR